MEEEKRVLFERINDSESNLESIQRENASIFKSFGAAFRTGQLSKFDPSERSPRIIHHWKKLFSAVQNEQAGFLNFSEFSLKYEPMKFHFLDCGEEFYDTDFAQLNNLNVAQQRARSIYNNDFEIFDESVDIEPTQVQQGQLGDCYLISSISAIAEFPVLCRRLFVEAKTNKVGIYGVWLFESGEWKQIIIDDFLPTSAQGNTIFARPVGKGIWVQLLEKAYAKAYNGYSRIEVGHSCDSLRDLTGSPTEYIDIKKNFAAAFAIVMQSLRKNYILTASSQENSSDLQSKHSYTIFDAREVRNAKGQLVKLLKIKNPLGFNFQKGIVLDQEVIGNLGEQQRQPNGILWMSEQEVLSNFEVLTVCHTHTKYVSGSHAIANKTMQLFYVQNLSEDNHCYFSIVQKHERFYRNGPKDARQFYKTARIIIARIDTETKEIVEVIGGNFGNKQQTFFEVQKLPVGEYLVFTEVDAKDFGNWFSFTCFSQSAVSIARAEEQIRIHASPAELVLKMFEKYVSEKEPGFFGQVAEKLYDNTKGSGQVLRVFSSLFGFAFIAYMNRSESPFTEKIEVVNSANLELTDFTRTQNQKLKEVTVVAGENRMILYRILENNACSHSLNFKGTWFFGSGVVKMMVPSSKAGSVQMQQQKQLIQKPMQVQQPQQHAKQPSSTSMTSPVTMAKKPSVTSIPIGVKPASNSMNAARTAVDPKRIGGVPTSMTQQKPATQVQKPAVMMTKPVIQKPVHTKQASQGQVATNKPAVNRVSGLKEIMDMYSQF